MKKTILILLFFLLTNTLFAQLNLVPNGDFEIYSSLPTGNGQSNRAVGWNNVNGDYSCAKASPDYFNVLSFMAFGAITPYSGNGQMGLCTYWNNITSYREYISTQFTTPMIIGHKYTISFYLTNGTEFIKGANNFGICFSNNPLFQATWEPIPVIPQIEIDSIIYFYNYWQHFSFNYIADSSYNIITIGNFRDDAYTLVNTFNSSDTAKDTSTAYYFIDKIEIIPVLNIIGDTILCKGDTATLTATADSTVKWANALKPDSIISTDITIKATPDTTTTYLAYGNNNDTTFFTEHVVDPPVIKLGNDTTLCNGYSIILNATTPYAAYTWQDSSANPTFNVTQAGTYWVKVSINSNCFASDTINISYQDCKLDIYIPNSFTPNGDGLNDIFKIVTLYEFSDFKLLIFNRWGELLFESTDINNGWDGTYKGKLVPLGVYVYLLTATVKDTNEQIKKTGRITVVR